MKKSTVSEAKTFEKLRIQSLRSYDVLDTVDEAEYDSITKIAAGICNVPVSLMTLMDSKRQWFKSRFGFDIRELPRELAFCNHLLSGPNEVLVVPDLREDDRFAHNPLVAGDPHVVFYAGAPLVNAEGFVLGSICVYDQKRNLLTADQKQALEALAFQVMNSLELRKKLRELKKTQHRLKKVNQQLRKYAHVISHDIKTPLATISMLTTAVAGTTDIALQKGNRDLLDLIHHNARTLQEFIDGVLQQSQKIRRASTAQSDPKQVIERIIRLIGKEKDVQIEVDGQLPLLAIDETNLHQILQNLITNAIKYNDSETVRINISGGKSSLTVTDNGRGIPTDQLKTIFQEHHTLGQVDRYGNKGTGIGLCTVKQLLLDAGGDIAVESGLNEGSSFTITLPSHRARAASSSKEQTLLRQIMH